MDSPYSADVATSAQILAYPLSVGQKALWSLYQTAPDNVAYNLSGAVAVPGDTDLNALGRAFQRLAERHPMLRTIFAAPEGEPVQRVLPEVNVDFRREEASAWDPARLDALLAEEMYRPFDLERRPAWRVLALERAPIAAPIAAPFVSDGDVARASQPEHLVLLVFHHILGDLWSIAVMMSEVAALYREAITGVPAGLKPLRASYADHVAREEARLAGPQAETSWEYWRARLSGDVAPLDLPADRPRLTEPTGRGAAKSIMLDRQLTERLRALAEARHVALYTVLLSAFQTLLHRYSAQDDVLVGFPKAGRSHVFARVVGYFVNTVVMRADFAEHLRFADLLQMNQRALDESAAHDWYPFANVVQRLRPAREIGRSPIVQAMFAWQKTTTLLPPAQAGVMALGQGASAVDLGGLRMRPIPITHRVAPVDLTLAAAEGPNALVATLEYRTDLFDAATIARMAESYRILLDSIARDPEQLVSRLPVLPEAARRELLETWNATAMPYPSELLLHQFVERQAELAPETLALVASDTRLTYRTLNQQANQLAHYLRQQGVGPDTPVALLCTRSAQALIGLLAILKAGGAYTPLDASYPDERLAFMLRDSAATLLLTERGLEERLMRLRATGDEGALSSVRVLFLDGDDADVRMIAAQSKDNPPCVVTPDHLAYLIYTSGSTGQPNGVALSHRGVVSLLSDFQRRGPLSSGDACSWWTSLSFDVAVYEIFSAWLAGATLHVIPEQIRLVASALFEWLRTHRIRSAYLPPFLLADYARWLDAHPGAAALQRLLVGVEPIPEHVLMSICAQLPDLCLLNGYGPSETTICSTLNQVATAPSGVRATSDAAAIHQRTPIGRPVANTQVYLLDRERQPVPLGVVGEVYIGGVGLARGYWRRPALTAERFVPDPFSVQPDGQPGARLYRTGDLARMLPEGNLEYVGRRDSQVKLRGYRIELGEIEAALAQHPNVKQAAVLLRQDDDASPGDTRLVAYLTPIQEPTPAPDDLRRFLAQRLPHAMMPSVFVVVDAFPLTPSGKVDRRALAAPSPQPPEQARAASATSAYQTPRTDVERILAMLWQEALGVERVGVKDNFFELGGDSIMGIQIIARAADAGLHLTPRHIFEAPTVAELAALAEAPAEAPVEASASTASQPEQGILEGEVPLTPVQRWFLAREFPNLHHWNQALLLLTRQPLDPAALRAAVAALLEHHDALRLRYTRTATGWRQAYAGLSEEIPCEVIDLSALPVAEQTAAIEAHAAALQRSLNLSAGPLIRMAYFPLGAAHPGRLLIIIHHLACDGVSWRILIEDLQIAYRQAQRGVPIRLPPKTTSYRDWAQRLNDLAQSSQSREEASFWFDAAGGELPTLPIDMRATDHAAERMWTEGAAQRVSGRLSREETQALLRVAPARYGVELNAVLLTALALAFQRWTGSPSLWLDLEGHGREDIGDGVDLTRSVGWFTAVYPVRLDLPRPSSGSSASVQAISAQLRRISRHGLGYGLLRYLCADPALTARITAVPSAQVGFNYLGQIHPAGEDVLIAFPAPESIGPLRSPDAPRAHLLDVDAAVIQGEMRIDWTYCAATHHRRTVEQVASFFLEELRALLVPPGSPDSTDDVCRDASTRSAEGLDRARRGAWLASTKDATLLPELPELQDGARDPSVDVYPLSPMQQGMLFHTLLAPGSGIYIEQLTGDIQGALDIPAFERAWRRALERHSILRSSFLWRGSERMRQVVHKVAKLPLTLLEWRAFSSAEREAHFDALLAAERSRGFDLTVAPLMRLTLARVTDDTHRLMFTYHHAVLDGWSVALLFKELFALYEADVRQENLLLPPARPYRDYIAWLQAQDLGVAETFWRNTLAGSAAASTLAPMPLQRASALTAGASLPAEHETRLSTETTDALRSLARQQRLTLNTIVQGAWALLLSSYAQRGEVMFGVTVAGRPPALAGIERMVGLFINTLPLRVRVDPQAHLLEWLQRLQREASAARQYDYSPLIQIQEWSDRPRGAPLFETILAFENYPIDPVLRERTGGMRIGNIRIIERINYPLAVVAVPGPQLQLKVVYDSERFESAAMERLLSHLRLLLERMAVDPDQRLAALSLPDAPQRRELMEAEREPDQSEHPRVQAFVPAQRPLERRLARLWQELLKVERVGVHDDFFELGGNSLVGAALINRLYEAMHEDVALTAIFEAPTVAELARYLEEHHPDGVARLLGEAGRIASHNGKATVVAPVNAGALPPALVAIQPHGARPPLFCVHPAGGIVFPYYTLAPYLGKEQPLYGLQDPNLYRQRGTFPRIEDMAAHYVQALQAVQPEGPYYLLGWSVGGLVAYEMAQQLTRNGQVVAALCLLDTAAPAHSKPQASQRDRRERLQLMRAWVSGLPAKLMATGAMARPILNYVRSGLYLLAVTARRSRTERAQRASAERTPTLLDLLRWAGLDTWRASLLDDAEVATTVSRETSLLLVEMPAVRRILELVREHKQLARRYVAKTYRGRITLVRAEPAEQRPPQARDSAGGWGTLAQGGVETHTLRASHVALLVKPHVAVLAHEVSMWLERSRESPSAPAEHQAGLPDTGAVGAPDVAHRAEPAPDAG